MRKTLKSGINTYKYPIHGLVVHLLSGFSGGDLYSMFSFRQKQEIDTYPSLRRFNTKRAVIS